MKLNRLSIKDKAIFCKYLGKNANELAAYAFENIYIWKELFRIEWVIIEDSLCVFFEDKIGCFLYLAPLGKNKRPGVLEKVFKFMDDLNKNNEISRIENVQRKDLPFYQDLGYECKEKFGDYLCKRADLVRLQGNKFKHKRAAFNYFIKHYKFEYLPFALRYKDDCLKLYNCWMTQRRAQNQDPIYQDMLQDSQHCLKIMLDNYSDLDLLGRLVKIDEKTRAFTFGFKLSPDTFCILYEITDLSIKGLAQFIFRQFCSELKGYKYINIIDDSGLENLKRVKRSYQPIRLIPSYIVTRKS